MRFQIAMDEIAFSRESANHWLGEQRRFSLKQLHDEKKGSSRGHTQQLYVLYDSSEGPLSSMH